MNFLFEELALGLAKWAEKPLKAACFSRASNKKAILTDGINPSWGLGFDVSRGDRIRTCGILLPKQARYQTAPLPDSSHIWWLP